MSVNRYTEQRYDEGLMPRPPIKYLDPITFRIMNDPVTNSVGETYDRKNIKGWYKARQNIVQMLIIGLKDPNTNRSVTDKLIPNKDLREEIEIWLSENPTYIIEPPCYDVNGIYLLDGRR